MSFRPFEVVAPYKPVGDQPAAIETIATALQGGQKSICLLGATGTGKTFTMANVIERLQKPTLILSHNKTLAAQLYEEMKELFPRNAVSYFVSYYDFYQPEAYIPQRDIYIEKDASRNDDLDRLRLAATSHLVSRDDVIVVASVSCIFGLGSPEEFKRKVMHLQKGGVLDRRAFMLGLADMQYQRNEFERARGTFRARGDIIEVHPANQTHALRIELFGDEIETLQVIEQTSGELIADVDRYFVTPAVQYVMPEDQMLHALQSIREELDQRVMQLRHEGKLLEAQRLMSRTRYDLEMIQEVGYCSGIENYSRFFDGRTPGETPFTLLDYFNHVPGREKGDWLLLIDESHVTMPQVRAMFNGDKARKQVLVDHGFRLPSALDNRPLRFDEFEKMVPRVVYVSATPAPYELDRSGGHVAEQVIRPTGLVDPVITVLPADGQIPDLIARCQRIAARNERIIVTALTKRLCEDLTRYLTEKGLATRYLHSDIETLDRWEILRALREGEFSVLVGVNLLREGLDLPEVSLVAILDADKEGFLRSATSLIQQIGRCARNVNAEVVMYADRMTAAMSEAIDETSRRREKQLAFNAEHGITPTQIVKAIRRGIELEVRANRTVREVIAEAEPEFERVELIGELEKEMLEAAQRLDFERAAHLRDQIKSLKTSDGDGKVRRSELDHRTASPGRQPGEAPPGVAKPHKRRKRHRA